ncbi:efflux RND transporter periplasmic adaptor subunit [candidate division KSB1 bacterium]|nr:efflux RND transporter periplasmic adaptor subunit [candidate division KSB1 bacterium]
MKYLKIIIPFLAIFACDKAANQTITGSGVMEGTEVVISSKAIGEIVALDVKEGDVVQQKAVLGKIDDEKLLLQRDQIQASIDELEVGVQSAHATIAAAQANYTNAKKQYDRMKALLEDGSTTQQQFDNIQTQFKNADTQLKNANNSLQTLAAKKRQLEAQFKLMEKQIDDCQITSPILGVILEKYKQAGEFAAIGLPILSVADIGHLWIKLYVSETDLGHVKLGADADIKIDSFPDRTFPGKIIWISPKAEFTPHNVQTKDARTDLVYAVKIDVANPDRILKIGMPADIIVKK